jgi:hypothetical protein
LTERSGRSLMFAGLRSRDLTATRAEFGRFCESERPGKNRFD